MEVDLVKGKSPLIPKLLESSCMGHGRTALLAVCWLASLPLLGAVVRNVLIQSHWYGFQAYLVRSNLEIFALGFCCVACLVGARKAPRSYWLNFVAILAVQAICFAIVLHYLAHGRLIVKDVEGSFMLVPM
jgi:hypothetical protein